MYNIILKSPAKKFLKKLDKPSKIEIIKKLKKLKNNPKLGKLLLGRLIGLWSLRIGDYRAIYQIRQSELLILILKIGHRKNIYD